MGALEDPGVKRAAASGDAWVMPPGNRIDKLRDQLALFRETRGGGRRASRASSSRCGARRSWPRRDEEAWRLFAPGIRHEYGKVYRPLHPTYPDDDSHRQPQALGRRAVPDRFAGDGRRRAARYQEELGATECLVRFQLPGVAEGAISEALDGFAETIPLVKK